MRKEKQVTSDISVSAAIAGINNVVFFCLGNTWALLQEMNRIVCEINLKVVISFF